MNDINLIRDGRPALPAAPRGDAEGPGAGNGAAVPLLTQYLRIATRWRWLILGSIVFAVLIGIVLTLLATPLYTATTRIEIARDVGRIVETSDVQPESSAFDQEFYQTQYGLLSSRSLAQRVARELRLGDNPEFFAHFRLTEEFERLSSGGAASAREQRLRLATDILLQNITISPVRMSRLVDLHFESPDPALSARVSNSWATSFIQTNLERRFEATAYARRFLEQRLEQLRARLDQSERQLVGYASREGIINIPVAGPAGSPAQERSLTADSLAALNTELAGATAQRVQSESRLGTAGGGASSEALNNAAIATMRARRAEVAAEHSRLLSQFEAGYPAVQALAAQLQQLDRSIAREESRVQASMQNAYRENVTRERVLAENVEGLKQNFLDQRRRSIQYNIFQRDVDTNRELYDGLLQRYKEIGIAGGVGTNNVSIVDEARVPTGPSYPRPIINLLLALFVGTVAGIGLALAREQIDESVTDPSDLERRIGLPLLGVIPASSGDELLNEVKDPKSSLMEAYLSLQTNLSFSTDHGVPRTLTVTSTRPAEGKSITAFAIAYTMARTGARTILVDGDMRSPSVHREVGLTNEVGLSNYLSGTGALDGLIQQPAGEPFAVMAAGPQPPNAAELLRSERLVTLLDDLLKRFDHVIIDSPPVLGLADAPIIASRTEAALFVIEARGVKARLALLAINRLRQGRAQLLGVILSKFEVKRAHYGYGYDYGYGYGRTEDKKD